MVSVGGVFVPIAKLLPLTVASSMYAPNERALAAPGVIRTWGAAPKALLKVSVARVPLAAQPVPVVTVIVPLVSVPLTPTVGVVQAALPALMAGVLPPVMR